MNKAQERRRILLVDRKTQLKYVGIITATVLSINILVGFCVYFSVWTSLNAEYSKIAIAQKIQVAQRMRSYEAVREGQANPPVHQVDHEADLLSDHLLGQLKESFRVAEIKLVPILLLLLLVVLFEGIAMSNRIVGPIYHVEKSLEKLRSGDLTDRTHFRRKDEFKSLSDKLNMVSDQWNYNISTLKRQLSKISDCALDLKHLLGRYNPEMETQVATQAEQILKRIGECNNVLARFTVSPSNQDQAKE